MFKKVVTFYDESKQKKTYRITERYAYGSLGSIYKISDDECLKLFRGTYPYDIDALRVLKELKPNNYYDIHELLFDANSLFVGYTMKFYHVDDIDITAMPTTYTLDNLYRLRDSVHLLSQNRLFVDDLHSGNTILDKDNITIIDADLYSINHDKEITKSELSRRNYRLLIYLFNTLYLESLEDHGKLHDVDDIVIDDLFNPSDTVKTIERKLVKYKYPIDYIKKVRKGIE